MYDVSRPGRDQTRNGIGGTGFEGDVQTREDSLTPIYNALRRSDGWSSGTAASMPRTSIAGNPTHAESIARFERDPLTAPIPSPAPVSGPIRRLSPVGPPEWPLTQRRTGPPMSALARERAAVEAMLAVLSLSIDPRTAARRPAPPLFTRGPDPAVAHLLRA